MNQTFIQTDAPTEEQIKKDKEEGVGMAAIKVPKECVQWIKDNPRVSEVVGGIVSNLLGLKDMTAQYEAILNRPETFSTYIDKGTQEDLIKFLNAVKESSNVTHLYGVTQEKYDKLTEELQKKVGEIASVGTEKYFDDNSNKK